MFDNNTKVFVVQKIRDDTEIAQWLLFPDTKTAPGFGRLVFQYNTFHFQLEPTWSMTKGEGRSGSVSLSAWPEQQTTAIEVISAHLGIMYRQTKTHAYIKSLDIPRKIFCPRIRLWGNGRQTRASKSSYHAPIIRAPASAQWYAFQRSAWFFFPWLLILAYPGSGVMISPS